MPRIDLRIDDSHLTARLEEMGPKARQAVKTASSALAQQTAADARAFAAAHIRFLGKKPGLYLASIYGGVADKEKSIIGFVRSGNPLAHLLEYGTVERFKKSGASTGAAPPYPAIAPAFVANRDRIEQAIIEAVRGVVAL
jgi:hypothetical protein